MHVSRRTNPLPEKYAKMAKFFRKLAVLALITAFGGTYIVFGNPILEEIADHGSAGVNIAFPPCFGIQSMNC